MADVQTSVTAWAVFSAIGGSVIGSIVGGAINLGLQQRALKTAKKQKDEERFDKRRALAFSLYVKMLRITSDLHGLYKAASECIESAKRAGLEGNYFQVVLPIAPLPDAVHFEPEEMALILALDVHLFNEIAAYDQLHASTIALFDLYGSKRTKVMERFGAKMEGSIGTTTMTEDEYRWLAPRAVELDGLVKAMMQRSRDDGKEVWSSLEKLNALINSEFKSKLRLEMKEAYRWASTPAA